ncbi:MAG: ribosome small subunit-dependent GTPase A [candidate division Zixibacteria bacterium]|nr:ribosome small subunit-dependent GTPase A [candidate division Zixibacteria bacterium]
MNLKDLGWNEFHEKSIKDLTESGLLPARVTEEHKNRYRLICQAGNLAGQLTGRYIHRAKSLSDFPSVGDWVAISIPSGETKGMIKYLLPRKSAFSRKAVLSGGMPDTGGNTEQQVLAANIDSVFLVSGLDKEFNIRRIERYLSAAYDSGASPVIILNKADICQDIETKIIEVESIAFGVPVHPISANTGDGFNKLTQYCRRGETVALLGSSGVGKSTIINRLLQDNRIKTQEVREYDSKGRHTTTSRQMFFIPDGGIVIDTPGMREFQLWSENGSESSSFRDIEELAELCKFNDCQHQSEPGCAIKIALENGNLDKGRYRNYLKLKKEEQYLSVRKDEKEVRRIQREFDKKIRRYLQIRNELKKDRLI